MKNKHVSNNTLSCAERCQIAQLTVKLEKKSHGNYSAAVWKYFGELWTESEDESLCLDKDHRYCLLCLKREQELYKSNSKQRHISRVAKYSCTTSTGSLADHLFTTHNVDVRSASSLSVVRQQMSLEQTLAAAARNEVAPAKIHRFVRFVVYYFITTCAVECYWHCSAETVHYKSDETDEFLRF